MTAMWPRPGSMQVSAFQWLLIAFSLVSLVGCGGNLADVSGAVTLDGQPLRSGRDIRTTVVFQPISGSAIGAVGLVDESGRYQLSTGSKKGAVPGDYTVTCTSTQIIPSKTPGGAGSGRSITDPKYANAKTSGFQFTVQSGSNEFNIPLESRPGERRRAGID
jgi:hypothetical protein